MQKTGNITQIQPAGSFSNQHGEMFSFNMTIQCQDGVFTGHINSKSQNYPKNVGDEITVETSMNNYGMQFKKVNPQFDNAGGGQRQAAGTGGGRKTNDRLIVTQVVYKALKASGRMTEEELANDVDMIMRVATPPAPKQAPQAPQQQNSPPPQQQQYNAPPQGNQAPAPQDPNQFGGVDDIPF